MRSSFGNSSKTLRFISLASHKILTDKERLKKSLLEDKINVHFNATGPVCNRNDLNSVAFHRSHSIKDLWCLVNSLGSFPLNESKRDVIRLWKSTYEIRMLIEMLKSFIILIFNLLIGEGASFLSIPHWHKSIIWP